MLTDLEQDEMAKVLKEFPTKVLEIDSIVINVLDHFHTSFSIFVGDSLDRIGQDLPIDETQNLNDILIPDLFPSVRDDLVEKALGVPQTSLRFLAN
jgi:hypothetical protein